eukprot:Rmarinus@m.23485
MLKGLKYQSSGADSDGNDIASIEKLWEEQLKDKQWYKRGADYWKTQDATNDGMLGGYEFISNDDVETSRDFLCEIFNRSPKVKVGTKALDCGAGIGRVTNEVLHPLFERTDLLEVVPKFVERAKELVDASRVDEFMNIGIQDFQVKEGHYDCIYCQWVVCFLPDVDFMDFLEKARKSLKPDGVLVIKENHCDRGFVLDLDDASVTRSRDYYMALFKHAGMKVVAERVQPKFPEELFTVRMYAVR